MTTFLNFWQDEPPHSADDDETEKLPPPVFPLAGMQQMVTLIGPDGKEHWVRRGSTAYRVFKSHGYRIGGNS